MFYKRRKRARGRKILCWGASLRDSATAAVIATASTRNSLSVLLWVAFTAALHAQALLWASTGSL